MSKPFSFGAFDVRLEAGAEPRPARAEDDAPFRILVAGDFSGRAARGLLETGAALGERKAFRVDLDSLDATIARLEPVVRLRDGEVLRFRELDDFTPDALFARIPRFGALKEAGEAQARHRAARRPATVDLLDRILDGTPQEEAPLDDAGPDRVTELMREMLGAAAFKALEASWRGVDFLLRRLDVDGPLTLHLVDLSPEELRADLLASEELGKTGLHRLLVEKTVGTPGGHPWAALVVLGSFGPERREAEALGRIARIAAQAGTAVLAGAEPGILGCVSLAETPDPDDWTAPESEGAEAWAALRRLPEARFCGLALPRVLLRLPYGKEATAVEAFGFEELSTPPSHEEYLWGCPALATALLLGEAFLEDGWGLRPGSAQEISGLPFALVSEDGEKRAVPCAETLFTVRAAQAVTERGLMPLLTMKGTDTVRLAIFQSIADPHGDLAGLWG